MSLLLGLGTLALGAYQTWKGSQDSKDKQREIDKLNKDSSKMQMPSSIVQASDLARRESQRSQVAGYDLYKQQIEQSTAQGIAQSKEAATSAADVLGATTSLYGQQNQALTQLEIEGARQQAMAKQRYNQQLNIQGQWEQQQYYMNEYYPQVAQMNTLQDTLQSSYDMFTGGMSTMAGSLPSITEGINSQEWGEGNFFDGIFGGKNNIQRTGQGTEIKLDPNANPGGSIWG